MRNIIFILLFLFASITVSAQEVVIERPPFRVWNGTTIEIEKIVLNDAATILHLKSFFKPHNWIRIAGDTYIKADGRKLMIDKAEGIALDKEEYMDESGEKRFSLYFPPIDRKTKQIDFIESDCDDCFKILGIELKSKKLSGKVELPQDVKAALQIKDNGKSLEAVPFEEGDAVIKGHFLGYRPEMNYEVKMFVNDNLTNTNKEYAFPVSEDGSFEGKITLIHAMQVLFRTPSYNDYILLSPNKETSIYIDLQQKSCQESRLRIDKCVEGQYMFFTGANADINNQINRPEILKFLASYRDYDKLMKDIAGMTVREYKAYRMNELNTKISGLDEFNLTRRAHDFLKLVLQYNTMYYLMFSQYDLEEAYKRAHNNDMSGFVDPYFDKDFYSFLRDSPINDPISLYSQEFGNMVNSCKYIYDRTTIEFDMLSEDILQAIEETEDLTEDERESVKFLRGEITDNWTEDRKDLLRTGIREVLTNIIGTNKLNAGDKTNAEDIIKLSWDKDYSLHSLIEKNGIFFILLTEEGKFADEEIRNIQTIALNHSIMPDSVLSEKADIFKKKYREKIRELERQERAKRSSLYLANTIGADKGVFFDVMEVQKLSRKFEDYEPLDNDELEKLSDLSDPFYKQYLTRKNNELIAHIEKNKRKDSYKVHNISEDISGDAIMHEIVKPFEGKVIMIDFWATWCGPCRSAMKRFESTKKSFEGKDVVFVYVTNQSSPQNTWSNMIPDMGGEHIRLTKAQFDYLNDKYGIQGIPAYLILNKKGEQVYFRVGFEGPQAIANVLNTELAK